MCQPDAHTDDTHVRSRLSSPVREPASRARATEPKTGWTGRVRAALSCGAISVAEAKLPASAIDARGLGGTTLREGRGQACPAVQGRSEHALARRHARRAEGVDVALLKRV